MQINVELAGNETRITKGKGAEAYAAVSDVTEREAGCTKATPEHRRTGRKPNHRAARHGSEARCRGTSKHRRRTRHGSGAHPSLCLARDGQS